MKPYTFYIHDGVHEVPSFEFVWCDNEFSAADHANDLLLRYPEYLLVEVFDGSTWRVQVKRDGVPVVPGAHRPVPTVAA